MRCPRFVKRLAGVLSVIDRSGLLATCRIDTDQPEGKQGDGGGGKKIGNITAMYCYCEKGGALRGAEAQAFRLDVVVPRVVRSKLGTEPVVVGLHILKKARFAVFGVGKGNQFVLTI